MFVNQTAPLVEFCKAAEGEPFVCVDTEFLREKTYFPKLCLIQVATRQRAIAIDPLAPGMDLSPLFSLMANQAITKVFHSGSQDLGIFLQEMKSLPRPVFDTQLAAMVCGFGEQPAYAMLVQKLVGANIDKASQMTDWSLRPLTPKQLDYALGDVTHLVTVYDKLLALLAANGRRAWIEEELQSLTSEATYAVNPREQWQRIKIRRASRRALAILREAAAWRELAAQQRNLPRNWVLKDDALAEIALNIPTNTKELGRVRSLPPRFGDGPDGQAIFQAIATATALPISECPPADDDDRPTVDDNLVALLQALLRVKCDENGVAMPLVATRKEVEQLAAPELPKIRALEGWRREVFGADAIALREGRLSVGYHQGKVTIIRS